MKLTVEIFRRLQHVPHAWLFKRVKNAGCREVIMITSLSDGQAISIRRQLHGTGKSRGKKMGKEPITNG